MKPKITIQNTALIVIDIINDCCHEKCESKGTNISFNKIREMIPKLKQFIQKYKRHGGKVVYVNCVPWREEFLAKNIVELYKDPECRYYSSDESGFSEEFFKLKPDKEDLVITKNTYDAFTNPKFDKFLKENKITHLIITGIFGEGCVHATIQGGFSKGYNFIIVKDLIETTDVKIRQELQEKLKKYTWPVMFGQTINHDEVLDVVCAFQDHS